MEIKTLFVLMVTLNLFLGTISLVVSRERKYFSNAFYWVIANFLMAAAYLMFGVRTHIPEFISILFGNMLLVFAGYARIMGFRELYGVTTTRFTYLLLGLSALLIALALAYFTFVKEDFLIRSILVNSIYAALAFYVGWIILQNRYKIDTISVFTSFIFFLFSGLTIAKIVEYVLVPESRDLFSQSVLNYLRVVFSLFLDITWTGAFLLINLVRANNQLADSEQVLNEQKRELQELNATKDKFFSIISHDLKNPVNSMMGFSELLLSEFDQPESKPSRLYAERIYAASKKTAVLLMNLLDWARSQQKKMVINPVDVQVNGIVAECVGLFDQNALDKQIRISQEVPESISILADREMVKTVLRNLLSNAIKFTQKGGTITVTARTEGEMALISVSDNGVGMDAQTSGSLFTITNKPSTAGTGGELGTGLGLSLCKEFVDLQGGTIWVESEPEKGSNFQFTLPLSRH